jgi:hypothetical protein
MSSQEELHSSPEVRVYGGARRILWPYEKLYRLGKKQLIYLFPLLFS